MRIVYGIILSLLLMSNFAYADISFGKTWSDTDNGSSYDGSDIGDMQADIISQAVDMTGTQTISGNKTLSGTVAFTGTVTGVGTGAKDMITRGFELVWDGPGDAVKPAHVIINPGTLYNGNTQVNLTSTTHVEVTTNGDWIDGSAKDYSGGAGWAYVYVGDTNAKIYFDENAPTVADTSGNTAGTKYYYTTGGEYYRCIGAVRINISNQVNGNFTQIDDLVMYDIPVDITTSVPGSTGWTLSTSCSIGMPSISKRGIFGLYAREDTDGQAELGIRPAGTTWNTTAADRLDTGHSSGVANAATQQRICFTDSSQQIDYYALSGTDNLDINLEGYYLDIR